MLILATCYSTKQSYFKINFIFYSNIQCLIFISKLMNLLGQSLRIVYSWTRIKVISVHISSICSPQISSQYHSKEQLCNYEASMFISECLYLYINFLIFG